jgi:two-component system, cell cycle response regulator
MSHGNPDNKKPLDLTAALRILTNAGCPDPLASSDDPDVQVQNIIDALCDLSIHDGLTGLVNATFFHAVLTREIDRSYRTGRTCGLMVIDIDHFKSINDTYGHNMGDRVLQSVAAQMKHSLRGMDTAARIGGEEFAIIFPECDPDNAIHAATRIHSMLNPLTLSIEKTTLQLTASAGLVWTNPNHPVSSTVMVSEADQEMYRAKNSGRSRLCYTRPESTVISHPERSALMALRMEEDPHGR